MVFFKKLYNLLKPFHRTIKLLLIAIFGIELLNLVSPYLLKKVIDEILDFNKDKLIVLLLFILGIFIFNNIASYLGAMLSKRIIKFILEVERYLPLAAQEKFMFLSLGYHERENTGAKITKVLKGVERVDYLLNNLAWGLFPTLFQVFITFFALAYFSWQISLIFIFFVPIFIWLTFRMNKLTASMRRVRHEMDEKGYGMMVQSVMNINTVQSFVKERKEVNDYKKVRDEVFNTEYKEFGIRTRYNIWRNFVVDAGRVSVLLFSVYAAYNGSISLGSLVFFITLSEKAYISLFNVSRTYDQIIEASEPVNRLNNLFKEDAYIKSPAEPVSSEKISGGIIFDKVNFSYYSRRSERVLYDVSFLIQPGERVALVGPSGGGKTTIIKLLYRHYDVTGGKILVDGNDIRKYDLYQYRSHLAIVPQEVEIFNATIKENIAYGRPDASDEEIKKAAETANADGFIGQLSGGYHTQVGERGIRLSGGQKQRVGIARAVLNDPRILIFDEATSSLDSESERLIQKALSEVSKGRTTLVIAHRLSTIIEADKIIVIENGKIVEMGNHRELRIKGGLYNKLLNLQRVGEIC